MPPELGRDTEELDGMFGQVDADARTSAQSCPADQDDVGGFVEGVVYRPALPEEMAWLKRPEHNHNFHLVCQADGPVFAYLGFFYPKTSDVISDVIQRSERGRIRADSKCDLKNFTVWTGGGRAMQAVVLQEDGLEEVDWIMHDDDVEPDPLDQDNQNRRAGIHGWPTRKQWLADGANEIVLRPHDIEATELHDSSQFEQTAIGDLFRAAVATRDATTRAAMLEAVNLLVCTIEHRNWLIRRVASPRLY